MGPTTFFIGAARGPGNGLALLELSQRRGERGAGWSGHFVGARWLRFGFVQVVVGGPRQHAVADDAVGAAPERSPRRPRPKSSPADPGVEIPRVRSGHWANDDEPCWISPKDTDKKAAVQPSTI